MSTRPTEFPRWATVPTVDPTYGGDNIVEPSSSRKDTGWLAEIPTGNIQNWFMNTVYQWLLYFDDIRESLRYTTAVKIATPSGEDAAFDYYTLDFAGAFTAFTDDVLFHFSPDTINSQKVKLKVDDLGWKIITDNGQGLEYIGGELEVNKHYLTCFNVASDSYRNLTRLTTTDAIMNAGVSKTVDVTPYDVARVIQQNKYLNIGVAGGSTAYTSTTTPSFTSLIDGSIFPLYFAGSTNTGACTLNINSIGSYPLRPVGGGDAPANYFKNGHFYWVRWRGGSTNDYIHEGIERATSAAVLAATDDANYVTPLNMKDHKGVAKAHGYIDGVATVPVFLGNYNFDSAIVDNGTGDYTFTLAVTMANVNYTWLGTSDERSTGGGYEHPHILDSSRTTTSFRIQTRTYGTESGLEDSIFSIAIFGDLA